MAEKEPRAGEHPLQLLPVDRLADENLAAHHATVDIDQAAQVSAMDASPIETPRSRARHGHLLSRGGTAEGAVTIAPPRPSRKRTLARQSFLEAGDLWDPVVDAERRA